MKVALTIAGSDSSGGAGIQADVKTMTVNGVFAESVITALTAQNTLGVSEVLESTPEFLEAQLDAVFTDIYPDAVKIGMVSNKDLIRVIAEKLKEYKAKNIVLDPVMVATSGSKLLEDDSIRTLIDELFPLSDLITPNVPEAEIISDMKIDNALDMEVVAKYISDTYDVNVLLKGGHMINDANDYLYEKSGGTRFYGKKIDNKNTHGTGCTLSSAIASGLAKGDSLKESIKNAKEYLEGALMDGLDLGKGSGPMNHAYVLKEI